jgi:hypothetical protein
VSVPCFAMGGSKRDGFKIGADFRDLISREMKIWTPIWAEMRRSLNLGQCNLPFLWI